MCHGVTPGAGVSHNTLTVTVSLTWPGAPGPVLTPSLWSPSSPGLTWCSVLSPDLSLRLTCVCTRVTRLAGVSRLVSAAQSRSGNWLRVSARSSLAAINSLSLSPPAEPGQPRPGGAGLCSPRPQSLAWPGSPSHS